MYWRLRLLSATLFAGVVSRSVSECNRAHRAVRNLRVDRVAMLFLVESELLDPVAQRAERHAEQFRGAGFVVARLLQRFADRVPLYFRSEEHTSELQSLMRISYAVFCLKKKNNITQ